MQLTHEVPTQTILDTRAIATNERSVNVKTPGELADIVAAFAASDGWLDRVRLRKDQRWYERLHHGVDHDIWAISWMPGQSTGFHDHGASAGAFIVETGMLAEHRLGEKVRTLLPGEARTFSGDYAHDVRNDSFAPAVSIHAYSPPLSEMNEYELDGSDLVPRTRARSLDRLDQAVADRPGHATAATGIGIDQMLADARARLRRLTPELAYLAVVDGGAVLVDIRPEAQRGIEGSIPGALILERNVLEWRLDPSSSARLAIATSHDLPVIVFCSEGYTSSLAAAALQDLGLWRATDIVGGFQAWRQGDFISTSPAKLPSVSPTGTGPFAADHRDREQHPGIGNTSS